MTGLEHLLKSYDVGDELDAIARSDPPAYMRRCFAEGISSPESPFAQVQQITVCLMVLDSILNDRDYESIELELVADWRAHYGGHCAPLKDAADAAAELEELEHRLAPA
jgi:hypothetical protein